MGSLSIQERLEPFLKCHFPVASVRRPEGQESGVALVSTLTFQDLGALDVEEAIARYQAAWAFLLHSYTTQDHVAFLKAHVPSADGSCWKAAASSGPCCSCSLQYCQYEILPCHHIRDLRPLFELDATDESDIKHRVNTAITFERSQTVAFSDGATTVPASGLQTTSPVVQHQCHQRVLIDPMQLDLSLKVLMGSSSVSASVRYTRGKISDAYAQRIVSSAQHALSIVTKASSESIRQQALLTPDDRVTMARWNPTSLRSHSTECMHHLVAAKASEIPNAEAICAWDGNLSYKELDSLASAAACKLMQAGVQPGCYVVFAFEKSLWAVVAAYGILKAGGAFVPVDPTYPRSRLREIIRGTQARFLVTSDLYASAFKTEIDVVVLVSETGLQEHPGDGLNAATAVDVKPSDPIFVLFTSGSTGKPKGMILEHGAICTHALIHGEQMEWGARVLQFAAHTFDVAIMDFFTTLLYGGVICIPSEEDRRSDVVGAINRFRADFALLTPSFAGLIDPLDVPTLKKLAIGGEALSQDRVRRWAQKACLIQVYGPAEVGICVLRYMSREETMPENIGYRMPNSSCWLVHPDDASRLVPVGAVGEMVITGPRLASGYLNDEATTRNSFEDDLPWATDVGLAGARFYKSGDLLRYNTTLCDGSYDFVGRKDTQIKLRGQRMELGEVEHHIASIPTVAVSMVMRPNRGCFAGELLVVLQARDSRNSRIVHEPLAVAHKQGVTIDAIRSHLEPLLPAYMLPTAALAVKSMPFVPSLKINRKMVESWIEGMTQKPLHLAAATLTRLGTSPLRPEETTARLISAEIARLLNTADDGCQEELLGADFNLQDAGLDSIKTMSLSMFLQRRFGARLPSWTLLSSKVTVRDVASFIDKRQLPQMLGNPRSAELLADAKALSKEILASVSPTTSRRGPTAQDARHNVLLTGASGYLGSAILKQLLDLPYTTVFALVRCQSEGQGLQQLVGNAKQQGNWWREAFASRLTVWRGDLGAPRLGLQQAHLQALQGSSPGDGRPHIHSIIHNGATVHYGPDYSTLKAANVSSTVELLRIAAESSSVKEFVFVSGGRPPTDGDDAEQTIAESLVNDTGYAQTKFAAEHIVRAVAASAHGAFRQKHVGILRPGYIVGSFGGRPDGLRLPPNQRDYLWRLIAGCIEIGGYSAHESSQWLCVADVEHVASAAVAMISDQAPGFASKSMLDGLPFEDLWRILRSYGYRLEPLPHAEWRKRMRAAVEEKGERHLLFPLLHMLDRDLPDSKLDPMLLEDVERLEAVRRVIRRNVEHLIEIGFLPRAVGSSSHQIDDVRCGCPV